MREKKPFCGSTMMVKSIHCTTFRLHLYSSMSTIKIVSTFLPTHQHHIQHRDKASRETSPQPSSSTAGSRLPRHSRDTSGPSRSNGGRYSPRERAPAREPKIKLWSLQEIEAQNLEMMNLETSTDVFQKYVDFAHTLKNPRNLTTAEVQFLLNAQTANHQIRLLHCPAPTSFILPTAVLSGSSRIQESLQSMATLISNSEVEDIKTYTWQRHTYKMSIVINTLMHDAASNISRLSTRFDTHTAATLQNASINSLLLRIQRLSI